LLIGIMFLVLAVKQLITSWTPKSSLVPLKGTLQSCNSYVIPVNSTSRYGYETKSQKAELVFYLNEHKKKFAMMENIGSNFTHKQFDEIDSYLRQGDVVTVWVKKRELDYWAPQVFQIETDRGTVLEFETVRFKNRPLTVFFLLFGIGCILLPLYAFYRLFNNSIND
jgi:hypothetical protein